MDSKLRRLAIACFVSLVALIVVVVYAVNADKISSFLHKEETAEETEVLEEATTDDTGEQIGDNLKGFLADEDFFDQRETLREITEEDVQSVVIYLTAGKGTIRVRIENERGGLETGVPFQVAYGMREGNGQNASVLAYARDEDQDGIILIEGLSLGTYEVTLQEMDGYHVPYEGTTVRVTEEAEAAGTTGVSDSIDFVDNGDDVIRIEPETEEEETDDPLSQEEEEASPPPKRNEALSDAAAGNSSGEESSASANAASSISILRY